eukprot:gnl/TRDRNA2_/TRDRNA2_206376_c0_seq1.p1 gnl/TRDRNA2_/TRDRNA2_206376_c0~~gnl/TRDRNA2_/TRDRNA2_206376_c0_seq1.p1  ORF type:complete len:195 (-),score=36.73 gnl/TRDRNA2_/TRDRNA2_206376_c0_seq1:85-669(-)
MIDEMIRCQICGTSVPARNFKLHEGRCGTVTSPEPPAQPAAPAPPAEAPTQAPAPEPAPTVATSAPPPPEPEPAVPAGMWACETCTFHNNIRSNRCGMCDKPRPYRRPAPPAPAPRSGWWSSAPANDAPPPPSQPAPPQPPPPPGGPSERRRRADAAQQPCEEGSSGLGFAVLGGSTVGVGAYVGIMLLMPFMR